MKKVILKDKNGLPHPSGFFSELENPQIFIDEVKVNLKLKDEQWVNHKSEPLAQNYDESDVLEERQVVIQEGSPKIAEVWNEQGELVQAEVPETPAIVQKQVKLKADYQIEIIDITAEHKLAECLKKRRAEYPSPEDFLNAWFDGGDAALEEFKQKRLAVKAKHPKPVGV